MILGKTATLQHHLASVNIPHAFIHCVEVYQPRLLFQVGGSSQKKPPKTIPSNLGGS